MNKEEKQMSKENKAMLAITDWCFKFAEGEICSTTFMSETMKILNAMPGESYKAYSNLYGDKCYPPKPAMPEESDKCLDCGEQRIWICACCEGGYSLDDVCPNCGFINVDGVEYIPPEAEDWQAKIAKRKWEEFENDEDNPQYFPDWLDQGGE